jgi:flagellar P-ring protein FlgI
MDILMMKYTLIVILAFTVLKADKIKNIARLDGIKDTRLVGYGIVVGLDGTGDSKKSLFTMQSVRSMLNKFGITIPLHKIQVKNAAAVMITASLSPFQRRGTKFDITVSSYGDAKSLQGGILLMTPLTDVQGDLFAMAQGAVSIGGFSVSTGDGGAVKKNYALVGRVPNGAIVEKNEKQDFRNQDNIIFNLIHPSFKTAVNIASAINLKLGEELAVATDAGSVRLTLTESLQKESVLIPIISELMNLDVQIEVLAKIVVNERTGTIVIGQDVVVKPVAIAHGSLQIEIKSNPSVSQPNPFSGGVTVGVNSQSTSVSNGSARLFTVDGASTVKDIASSLNDLGVDSTDLIAILQALKEAGALEAELVVL